MSSPNRAGTDVRTNHVNRRREVVQSLLMLSFSGFGMAVVPTAAA